MMQKLSLEQFRLINQKLIDFIERASEYLDNHRDDLNFDEEEFERQLLIQYSHEIKELLEYDLSDIPFEEWEDVLLCATDGYPIDLSKTHANIDFNIVKPDGPVIFKGCTIKNFNELHTIEDESYYDDEIIKENPKRFLSSMFSKEFKTKFYRNQLTIEDIATLNSEELREFETKDPGKHIQYRFNNPIIFDSLGFEKAVELFKYSKEDYYVVNDIIKKCAANIAFQSPSFEEFGILLSSLKNGDVSIIKDEIYKLLRDAILNSHTGMDLPQKFIDDNPDLFLTNVDLPQDVRERYLTRNLLIEDIIKYSKEFSGVPVESFMDKYKSSYVSYFLRHCPLGEFQKLVVKYPKFFTIIREKGLTGRFEDCLNRFEIKDAELALREAVKRMDYRGELKDITEEFHFKYVDRLYTNSDLLSIDEDTIVLDSKQNTIIYQLNINNIQRFERETGFFTSKRNSWSNDLEMFNAFSAIFNYRTTSSLDNDHINFKNGQLSYEEFQDTLANALKYMKLNNMFQDVPRYDHIKGDFREKYDYLFMDDNAPEELKEAFYLNRITPLFLYYHKDCIKWLLKYDLKDIINCKMELHIPGKTDPSGYTKVERADFLERFSELHGKEETLNIISKYGDILKNIEIECELSDLEDIDHFEQILRETIRQKIITEKNGEFKYLENVPEIKETYPDMFLDIDEYDYLTITEKNILLQCFYSKKVRISDIYTFPSLARALKDKNLFIAFANLNGRLVDGRIITSPMDYHADGSYSVLEFLMVFGNDKFLELCKKYGKYINDVASVVGNKLDIVDGKYYSALDSDLEHPYSFEEVCRIIESNIAKECREGNIEYYRETSPEFLIKYCPDLFLSDDAPDELKKYFYYKSFDSFLSFKILNEHKEWLPYLEGKDVFAAMLRRAPIKSDLKMMINLFGKEMAFKLGLSKPDTVETMMEAHKVDLMKKWYDKTGGKFIPDSVVMLNMPIEDADKFLISGHNWSALVRNTDLGKSEEGMDALLKLAYTFGIFDSDSRGFKKLLDLLCSLPKSIDESEYQVIANLNREIFNYISQDNGSHLGLETLYDENGMPLVDEDLNIIKSFSKSKPITAKYDPDYVMPMRSYDPEIDTDVLDPNILLELCKAIKEEMPEARLSCDTMSNFYRRNEDGSYTLTLNEQRYPKITKALRACMTRHPLTNLMTASRAHQFFGGFELRYDPDFRDFLLKNMDDILKNPEYITYLGNIQKQFTEIKVINSNRTLTLEHAISYIKANKYSGVNTGNERASEISTIAGYSQKDFDILQQIYNYGKQRTYSSIPRIASTSEKKTGKYSYEILRLDDPLALAIGTLTDCCQELNDCAEVCMEHSMVDKHGRVFVIKDYEGNIVAQSWVWRNKDILCFDNIEIPMKAFTRVEKAHPELDKSVFTQEIFEIYKAAAKELMEEDERVYKGLLEEGKITQEEYDGLRLAKVTVGLGYNDIADAIKEKSVREEDFPVKPLPFEEPVKLKRSIYTSDSRIQYILESRPDRILYYGDTITPHSDTFEEYTDETFELKHLITLAKLELVTKNNTNDLEIYSEDYEKNDKIVSRLARNYGLNDKTARIIMNPNFAIIYDVNGSCITIADLFYNLKVDNNKQQLDITNKTITQIRLALNQIGIDKYIDASKLSKEQQEIFNKAMNLDKELDEERGLTLR